MKRLLLLTVFIIVSCANRPPVQNEILFKIDNSEAPAQTEITITIEKNCEGNWNFCKWQ